MSKVASASSDAAKLKQLNAKLKQLKEENAGLKAEVHSLREKGRRTEIECEILVEGCALIREVASNYSPAVSKATQLQGTVFKVLRFPDEMKVEIDRRLADPMRTWWDPSADTTGV